MTMTTDKLAVKALLVASILFLVSCAPGGAGPAGGTSKAPEAGIDKNSEWTVAVVGAASRPTMGGTSTITLELKAVNDTGKITGDYGGVVRGQINTVQSMPGMAASGPLATSGIVEFELKPYDRNSKIAEALKKSGKTLDYWGTGVMKTKSGGVGTVTGQSYSVSKKLSFDTAEGVDVGVKDGNVTFVLNTVIGPFVFTGTLKKEAKGSDSK
jgi:hypothetical protein